MDTITMNQELQDSVELDEDVRDKITDVVLDRIHNGETTREILHDWGIAHPQVIDGILTGFLSAGLLMIVDGVIHHTRLVEYV